MEAATPSIAIARARSLASAKAGAIAFSRTGDPNVGEFQDAVVLFKEGDVPESALAEAACAKPSSDDKVIDLVDRAGRKSWHK